MPPHTPSLAVPNGNEDDWDKIRDLPPREKFNVLMDRSLDVFQQVGHLEGLARKAADNSERSRKSAERAEAAAERTERLYGGAHPYRSLPPPQLQELTTIDKDDPTGIRELKQKFHDASVIEAADKARLSKALFYMKAFLTVAAVAAVVWAIFRFALANAK